MRAKQHELQEYPGSGEHGFEDETARGVRSPVADAGAHGRVEVRQRWAPRDRALGFEPFTLIDYHREGCVTWLAFRIRPADRRITPARV